jgi:hypothetical protein
LAGIDKGTGHRGGGMVCSPGGRRGVGEHRAGSAATEARFSGCSDLSRNAGLQHLDPLRRDAVDVVPTASDGALDDGLGRRQGAEYRIEGKESMGNGGTAETGHASVVLSSGRDGKLGLAKQSMTVGDLFPGETVEFPFGDLDGKARSELSGCF